MDAAYSISCVNETIHTNEDIRHVAHGFAAMVTGVEVSCIICFHGIWYQIIGIVERLMFQDCSQKLTVLRRINKRTLHWIGEWSFWSSVTVTVLREWKFRRKRKEEGELEGISRKMLKTNNKHNSYLIQLYMHIRQIPLKSLYSTFQRVHCLFALCERNISH